MLTVAPDAGHMLPLERDRLVSGALIRLVRARTCEPTSRTVSVRAAAVMLAAGSGSAGRRGDQQGAAAARRRTRSWPTRCGPSSTSRACTGSCSSYAPRTATPSREAVAPHLGAHDLWVVDGGEQRHDSEWQALRVLRRDIESGELDVVAIHDGARPLASPELWRAVIDAAAGARRRDPGRRVPPAVPRSDGSLAPDGLVGVQTPAGVPGRRPARGLPPRPRGRGSSAPTPAACLERYSEVAIAGRGEYVGQPEGDLPRGHRARRGCCLNQRG